MEHHKNLFLVAAVLIAFLITPVYAVPVYTNSTTLMIDSQFCDINIWYLITLLGFGLFILSNIVSLDKNASLYAILAPLFFGLSAWFSTGLQFSTTGITSSVIYGNTPKIDVTTGNIIYHVDWLSYLMIVIFLLSIINVFYIFTKKPVETQKFKRSPYMEPTEEE
ncbi:MAG: hypothetical protein MUO73_02225 [Thermoplasmata archaeon]|nr:hypothetical protein [Thermoplasmata archaeon]